MPKRTNAFQKLVLHVQKQLAADCEVTESAPVIDLHTGEPREVDILIKKLVAGEVLSIGVECIAHDRPATVEWVDEMIGKHQSLPTDVLVLVSESGFTESAARKAQIANVRTVAIGEARQLDWTTVVGKSARLFLARFDFSTSSCTLLLTEDQGGAKHSVGIDLKLVTPDGQPRGTAGDYGSLALRDIETVRQIMDRMTADGQRQGAFDITFAHPLLAIDGAGNGHEVLKLVFSFTATRRTDAIDLRHGTWGRTPVSYGQGTTGFGKTFLAIEEPEPKLLRGTLTFVDPGTGQEISRPLGPAGPA